MGMQISVVFIPKCRRRTLYRELRKQFGRGISKASAAKRKSDIRRALDSGSCTYADLGSAEICSIVGGWIHQRQECDRCETLETMR